MYKIVIYILKFALATITALLLFISCQTSIDIGNGIKGNGKIKTENREVKESFNSIEVERGIEVEVTQGKPSSIVVEADENIIQYITTNINDGVLVITSTKSIDFSSNKKVSVTIPEILALSSSSGSQILSKSIINSSSLSLTSSSGSSIEVDIETEKVTCKSSSGSNIKAKGKTLELKADASSGSQIDNEKLLANIVNADASSGSSIEVKPLEKLTAEASSGGNVTYFNTPKEISKNESSGGTVSKN